MFTLWKTLVVRFSVHKYEGYFVDFVFVLVFFALPFFWISWFRFVEIVLHVLWWFLHEIVFDQEASFSLWYVSNVLCCKISFVVEVLFCLFGLRMSRVYFICVISCRLLIWGVLCVSFMLYVEVFLISVFWVVLWIFVLTSFSFFWFISCFCCEVVICVCCGFLINSFGLAGMAVKGVQLGLGSLEL